MSNPPQKGVASEHTHAQPPLPAEPPPKESFDIFAFPPVDFEDDLYPTAPFGHDPVDFLDREPRTLQASIWQLKHEITDGLRGPLQFRAANPITNWHGHDRTGLNADQFMQAFQMVSLALDTGYFPGRSIPLLGTQDWVSLLSAILVVIGRGYARTPTERNEEVLNIIHNSSLDNSENDRDPPFQNMFARLTATAEHLHTYLALDHEGARDWIINLQNKTRLFIEQHTEQAVLEALEEWQAFQIWERSKDLEDTIRCAVAESNKGSLKHAAV